MAAILRGRLPRRASLRSSAGDQTRRPSAPALAGVLALAATFTAGCEREWNPQPNVVLILADDLGYGQLGSYGSSHPTPEIDRIAQTGVRMTDGYAADVVCSPSRTSLLTGRYHQRFSRARRNPRLYRTAMQVLQQAGYATACIGKWERADPENYPLESGCDEFFGFLGGMHDYHSAKYTLEDYRRALSQSRSVYERITLQLFSPILSGRREVTSFDYLTREFSERAIDFIRRHRDAPFFLYLAYNAIHDPLQGPNDRSPPTIIVPALVIPEMIAELDAGVGRVLDTLEQEQLRENTLVIFTSDNGAPIETGLNSVNGPFRGGKELGSYLEGSIRVPFLWSWPATLPQGLVYREPGMQFDILPSIADAAGVPIEAGLDGVDLLPFLSGVESGSPHAILYWGLPNGADYAVRAQRWKLLRHRGGAVQLFDLVRDPAEQTDLADAEPERVRELLAWRKRWGEDVRSSRNAM